jgi:putative transferase (TIGR04331 family)
MKKHISDSFRFVESLPKTIQHCIVLRLTPGEHGWFHAERWRDQFSEIKIENGSQNIQSLIKKARLVISTYNQTTILETLAAGIPSVLFCDLLQTPLRDSAIPFYSKLKQVGIFHDTPESAASHVNRVWGDIDSWWFSEDVQSVVTEFTQQYCRRETGLVPRIRTVLKQAVRKENAAIV